MAKRILCKNCEKCGSCKEVCLDEAVEECVMACREIKARKVLKKEYELDEYEARRSKAINTALKRYNKNRGY